MNPLPRLYAIADASFGDVITIAKSLFEGGVQFVQVRSKKAPAGELLNDLEQILALAPNGARVLANDRTDIALVAGAHGVHLGQSDLPPVAARQLLGNDRIIGLSTHGMAQAIEADSLPIDYIAVGPIFVTSTKENAEPTVGIHGLAEICRTVRKPVVAIGGVRLENASEILAAGASSLAVIGDLLKADDVTRRAREWVDILETWTSI
jgi:thiamine-phosphate pyrophosphorylase